MTTGYVLFVHDNPGFGGVGHVAAQLADGLQQRGWDVEHWNVRHARGQVFEMAGRLARRRGIVVATQNFSAAYVSALVALLGRRPWVMWVHGPVLDVLRTGNPSAAKRGWLQWFYRRTRHAVCSSEASRASLLEFCPPMKNTARVDVIRNTAASSFFAEPRDPHAPGRELGFVGRLSPEKQPLVALEVLRALPPEYKLHFVGDGPLMPQLRAAGAQELAAGRLVLAGARTIVADTYRRWDVTLLCSIYEGYPLVPLESLASGVPVVSSPIPAVVEMLGTHAPCMLARDGTAAAIAQTVQDVLRRDPAQVQRAIAHVNRDHDPGDFVRRWDELLTEGLGR
jgi:glycosyltransferase involved in cell wall biosynthesis